MRYGLVIDLKKCCGCNACSVICKQRHGTPPGVFWSRVYVNEVGKYPNARREYLPAMCMHCANPPCVKACPTGASYKREDGIVLVDRDKCIGCRFCMTACPYNARFFDFGNEKSYHPGKDLTGYAKVQQKNYIKGTVSKCTFCVDCIDNGGIPACAMTCPTKARVFGDLDDSHSEVSRLIDRRGGSQQLPGVGTEPSVYYLPG